MDIKRLEYFCAIIEKGQIGKAAQSLHISQPPLSMRLRELEEELGVTLIHRRGKAWQITPEGQLLYQKAQFILSYMEGVKNDVSSLSGTMRDTPFALDKHYTTIPSWIRIITTINTGSPPI